MKHMLPAIIIGCVYLSSPALAEESPTLKHDQICIQLDFDREEAEIKLRWAIVRVKEAPHDTAAKFNLDLYEMRIAVLQDMLRRYCGWI